MKVAVNKCYGGFGISTLALKELALRNAKCLETCTPKHYYGGDKENYIMREEWEAKWLDDFPKYKDIGDGFMAHQFGFNLYKDGILYSFDDRSPEVRADKDLIEVIEALGDKANGDYAKIKIVDIPDDIDFEITEYDGFEKIAEKHRTW